MERELDVRRSELRESQETSDAKDKRIASLSKDLSDLRTEYSTKGTQQIELFQQQIRDLKLRLNMAETELMKVSFECTVKQSTCCGLKYISGEKRCNKIGE